MQYQNIWTKDFFFLNFEVQAFFLENISESKIVFSKNFEVEAFFLLKNSDFLMLKSKRHPLDDAFELSIRKSEFLIKKNLEPRNQLQKNKKVICQVYFYFILP